MACESCKVVVREAIEELDIHGSTVELGEITTKEDVSDDDKKKLNSKIRTNGMKLLEKKSGVLIEKIKNFMIDYVANSEDRQKNNFSELLSEKLGFSYTYLSNSFSEVESKTIQSYLIALKIERIKELIIFGDDAFSEIAHKLNYSSVAHLSGQFKKATGLTLSHYKALKEKRRINIEDI